LTTLFTLERETLGYAGKPVLKEITLGVAEGERIAVLGRSGAGKSTLLNIAYHRLVGAGVDVALVPQDHALVPGLSVFHNVYMGQLGRRSSLYSLVNLVRPWPREVAAVADASAPLAIEDLLKRPVATLSGGQRQRTAVARALFQGGSVLIADEPVSAVDEMQGEQILAMLPLRFATLIVALHDMDLALAFATRIIGLSHGRVSLDCPVEGLARERLHELYAD
jgi:phosphonate transport system ATP-binding protein